ncbi:hypothetical protein HKD37_06G016976 [Glycine soja]
MFEKPKVKRFHNKSTDPSLDELWRQPFEDSYSIGENVVAPSMDSIVDEVVKFENVNGEKGDKRN